MSDVPAGWFPDPSGAPGLLRYWDGRAWTPHVHQQVPPVGGPGPYAQYVQPTTPDGQPLAGWWQRVGATTVDSIFGAILATVITLPAQISIQRDTARLSDELQRRLDAGQPGSLSWFAHQSFELYRDRIWIFFVPGLILLAAQTAFLHYKGGTPGQLITGLRTRLRDEPGPLSWGRAALRGVLYLTAPMLLEVLGIASGSWVTLLVLGLVASVWSLLNPLWAAWDSKRQALHDKLVGTNVVSVRG